MVPIRKTPFRRTAAIVSIALLLGSSGCVTPSGRAAGERDRRRVSDDSANPNPYLQRLARRVRNQYLNKNYISFTSFVDGYQSVSPGWTVHPDKGIRPGAAFDVLMSSKGESNVKLRYGASVVYEWQVAVRDRSDQASTGSKEYVLREYDHVRGLRTEEQVFEGPPESFPLSSQALEPPEWCTSGRFTVTFVGPKGRVADRQYSHCYAMQIESGTLLARREGTGSAPVDVIRWVQQEAAEPRRGPAGQDLDASPAILWDTFVDRDRALIVGDKGYFCFPDRDPVLIRGHRYKAIRFPKKVDRRVFTDVPERARGYRVWKPGDPYPPKDAGIEGDGQSAASGPPNSSGGR